MAGQQFGPTVVVAAAQSPEELPFLLAIMANQLDEVVKLVYADWLEERGDPRGSFLREMVQLIRDPQAQIPPGDEFPLAWRQVVGIWPRQVIRSMIAKGTVTGPFTDRIETELLRRARPTLHLLRVQADDAALPPGCSKAGGLPDMPDGIEWPVFPNPYGAANAVFIGQIRLSDLHNTLAGRELPRRGLLSFFWCAPCQCRVLLSAEEGPFRRPGPPYDPDWDRPDRGWSRNLFPLPAGSWRFYEGIDLPLATELGVVPDEFWRGDSGLREALEMPPPDFGYDWDHPHPYGYGVPRHKLLGYGPEANAYPPPDAKPGVRRLATFSSFDDNLHYWGDSNTPYFYIGEEDLQAGRFERAACYEG